MSLKNFTISCEGDNKILKVYGAGITYPSKKHIKQNNICMFSDEYKKTDHYTDQSHFLCNKELTHDLVPYLSDKFFGKSEIYIPDISDLFKHIEDPQDEKAQYWCLHEELDNSFFIQASCGSLPDEQFKTNLTGLINVCLGIFGCLCFVIAIVIFHK